MRRPARPSRRDRSGSLAALRTRRTRSPRRPVQAQFRAIDRPIPAISGDVPVEAVLVRPETHLPPRQVADGVGVDAGRDEPVGVADADAHPVLQSRQLRRDGVAVETDVLQDKAGGPARSLRARVVGREIAIDAVPDLRPQHPKTDRLGDLQSAVGLQLHIAEVRSVWAFAAVAPKSSSASASAIRLATIVQPSATFGAARATSSPNSK